MKGWYAIGLTVALVVKEADMNEDALCYIICRISKKNEHGADQNCLFGISSL